MHQTFAAKLPSRCPANSMKAMKVNIQNTNHNLTK